MKTSKREKRMKQIAMVALISGIFSTNAFANPFYGFFGGNTEAVATNNQSKDGLSLSDLRDVVRDFEVVRQDNRILFAGFVPKRCANGAHVSYNTDNGKHVVTVRMPECQEGFQRRQGEPMEDLADIFPAIHLKDQDGKLHLRTNGGSRNSSERIRDELLTDIKGKEIEVISSETIARTEREAAEKEELERQEKLAAEEEIRQKKEEEARLAREAKEREERQIEEARVRTDLQTRINNYCKDEDYVGLSHEVAEASHLFNDFNRVMERVNSNYKNKLKKDLDRAETAEEARAAYEVFVEAAYENGWNEEELKEAYIDKRFELLNSRAEDAKGGDAKLRAVAAEVKEWHRDLKAIDRKLAREKNEEFVSLYAELATHAANKGSIEEAERFYDMARAISDSSGKMKIDGALAKIYAEKFKECVKNGPFKAEACERKWMSKAKAKADSIKSMLERQGGDDAADELAAFEAEYIQTFGAGQSMNVQGFGQMSQVPGMFEQYKRQMMMQAVQEAQMKQMMQMQGPQMMMPGRAPSGGSFFGM